MYSSFERKCSHKSLIYVVLIGSITCISANTTFGISQTAKPVHLKEGAQTILSCKLPAWRKPDLRWMRSNAVLQSSKRYTVSRVRACGEEVRKGIPSSWCSNLTIKHVIWADNNSVYGCITKFNRGVKSYILNVKYEQETEEVVKVISQKSLKLLCPVAVGDYPVTFIWHSHNQCEPNRLKKISGEYKPIFTIHNISKDAALPKFYLCHAKYGQQHRQHAFNIRGPSRDINRPSMVGHVSPYFTGKKAWVGYLFTGIFGIILGVVFTLGIQNRLRHRGSITSPQQHNVPKTVPPQCVCHPVNRSVHTKESPQCVCHPVNSKTSLEDSTAQSPKADTLLGYSSVVSHSSMSSSDADELPRASKKTKNKRGRPASPPHFGHKKFVTKMDEVIANAKEEYRKQTRPRPRPTQQY